MYKYKWNDYIGNEYTEIVDEHLPACYYGKCGIVWEVNEPKYKVGYLISYSSPIIKFEIDENEYFRLGDLELFKRIDFYSCDTPVNCSMTTIKHVNAFCEWLKNDIKVYGFSYHIFKRYFVEFQYRSFKHYF